MADAGGWRGYYAATAGRPPRRTLLKALEGFPTMGPPRFAVDLGCGDGRDTVELLRRGWRVMAIDAEAEAIERLHARTTPADATRLRTVVARMEEAAWPAADLVNASFVLPLCPPDRFDALWDRIKTALLPEGRFAGQLYGNRDGWAGRPGLTHHDRAAVLRLLAGLEIELLDEEESDGATPRGRPKHWHIFHIVARDRGTVTRQAI